MSDKEAVEAVHRAMTDAMGGWAGPNIARIALQAARPFHFEEAARDAIERAEIYEQSTTANTPGYKDAAIALRAFAAAIRAAKEKGG